MSSLLNLRMNYYFHFRTKYTEAGASQVIKILPANEGEMSDVGLILEGRSSGSGHSNPLQYSCLEKSPWTEEPDGLQSIGSQRVRHN